MSAPCKWKHWDDAWKRHVSIAAWNSKGKMIALQSWSLLKSNWVWSKRRRENRLILNVHWTHVKLQSSMHRSILWVAKASFVTMNWGSWHSALRRQRQNAMLNLRKVSHSVQKIARSAKTTMSGAGNFSKRWLRRPVQNSTSTANLNQNMHCTYAALLSWSLLRSEWIWSKRHRVNRLSLNMQCAHVKLKGLGHRWIFWVAMASSVRTTWQGWLNALRRQVQGWMSNLRKAMQKLLGSAERTMSGAFSLKS